ncbi:MAG: hypothetical protein J6C65_02285 [Prevotella sp.]|nr:hypothetical protein [Prevotella sp.]
MCEIKNLYKFFLDNKDSLIQKYTGQFLVISASYDVAAFPSRQEAYSFGAKTYGIGNMMIQECSDSALNKVRKFHSRVYRQ